MQKIIQILPILVVVAAISMIAYQAAEHHREKTEQATEQRPATSEKLPAAELPVANNLPEIDRQLTKKAFKSPETLDSAVVTERPATKPHSQQSDSMMYLSDEKAEHSLPVTDGDQDAYFKKPSEALTSDTLRDPDSEQNREIVESLLSKSPPRLAENKPVHPVQQARPGEEWILSTNKPSEKVRTLFRGVSFE